MTALLGPPWTPVSDPRAVLFADPPVTSACTALAVGVPAAGLLERVPSANGIHKVAVDLAGACAADAFVYRGAIQTRSGLWLWPFPVDRVEVWKIDRPLSRREFALVVQRLDRALRGASRASARRTLERALATLRRPWPDMSGHQVDSALEMLAVAIRDIPSSAAFRTAAATQLAQVTAGVAERSALGAAAARGVGYTFRPVERELASRIGRNGMHFITDEFGRRSARFSREARRIIGRGTEQGLGYREIASDLQHAMQGAALGRDLSYYQSVASAVVAQARSYGTMLGYEAAGVQYYMWVSVLDERTCDPCRWLHGQVFPVDDPLTTMDRALRNPDPEAAANAMPWYRVVGDNIHVQARGQPLGPAVAQIQQRGFGVADRVGQYRPFMSTRDGGGAMMPPAHARCRCETEPVLV